MKTRVLSGIAMVPLLAVVYFGGWLMALAVTFVCIQGLEEYYKGFDAAGYKANRIIGWGAALVLMGMVITGHMEFTGLWMVLVVLFSNLYLFNIEGRKLEDGIVTAFGIIYVVFFASHVMLVSSLKINTNAIWLVFITAFSTDIFAYFTGYFFGKHKMAKVLSPKKTWEGAFGGTLCTAIFTGVFFYYLMPVHWINGVILGIIAAIVSQLGDLSASAYKRKMDIKDYGKLIPGHGGIMDRFDSVLYTAPIIYYYCILVLEDQVSPLLSI